MPMIRELVDRDPGLLAVRDVSGNSLLCLASKFGQAKVLSFLLKQDIDANAANNVISQPERKRL